MHTSYKAICKVNKYLYAQLEQLTLLMGHAQVYGQTERYKEYLKAKVELKARIDVNLQLLQDHWERSAGEAKKDREMAVKLNS